MEPTALSSLRTHANAGTHYHRRQLLKRSRRPLGFNNIGRCVWARLKAGTTKFDQNDRRHLPRAAFSWHDRHQR
jgi:hypothetical protein